MYRISGLFRYSAFSILRMVISDIQPDIEFNIWPIKKVKSEFVDSSEMRKFIHKGVVIRYVRWFDIRGGADIRSGLIFDFNFPLFQISYIRSDTKFNTRPCFISGLCKSNAGYFIQYPFWPDTRYSGKQEV